MVAAPNFLHMKLATLRLPQSTMSPNSALVTATLPSSSSSGAISFRNDKPLEHYIISNQNGHHQTLTSSGRPSSESQATASSETGPEQRSRPATYAITYEAPAPQSYDRTKSGNGRILDSNKYPSQLIQLYTPSTQTTLVPLTLPLRLPLRFSNGNDGVSDIMSAPLPNNKQINQGQGQNVANQGHLIPINLSKQNSLKVSLIILLLNPQFVSNWNKSLFSSRKPCNIFRPLL